MSSCRTLVNLSYRWAFPGVSSALYLLIDWVLTLDLQSALVHSHYRLIRPLVPRHVPEGLLKMVTRKERKEVP
jgi:hypothetical protein